MERSGRLAALVTGAFSTVVLVGMSALCAPGASAVSSSGPPAPASGAPPTAVFHRGPDTLEPVSRAPAPAPVAVPNATREVTAPRHTADRAQNWSGEVALGPGVTAVSGSWTVPGVQPSETVTVVSTWVGIGGLTTDTPLLQTGTISFTTGGSSYYGVWYELLPTPPATLTLASTPGGTPAYAVKPGDVMEASITNAGGQRWTIEMHDETAGWTYEHTFTYASSKASADWITERPSTTTGSLFTLADYGSTRFTHLALARDGGSTAAPTALVPVDMYNTDIGPDYPTGDVISAPGPVSNSTGTSFTDHFVPVPARIFGATADGTAAAELEHEFTAVRGQCPGLSTTTRAVVLATDANYPDALASAYLARSLGTGTLLTPTASLSSTTLSAIRDEGITRVYVVGGPLAVSAAVVAQLESTPAYTCGGRTRVSGTPKLAVTRIAGETQYDTAEKIAETPAPVHVGTADLSAAYAGKNASGGDGKYNATAGNASSNASGSGAVPTAVVATGRSFPDAEAASTLAYADSLPILLTTPATLSPQTSSAIADLGIKQVVVMGGPLAVTDGVVSSLERDGLSVLRVAGADATQTAVELAECELNSNAADLGFGWPATGEVAVARGNFYADGLAGAVVAADGPASTTPRPLLLAENPETVGAYLGDFLNLVGTTGVDGKTVTHLTILGGPSAMTQSVANAMSLDLLG